MHLTRPKEVLTIILLLSYPLLALLFPGVSTSQFNGLMVNNNVYFDPVLTVDELLDQEGGPTRQQFIDWLTLCKYAVRALPRLFAPQ